MVFRRAVRYVYKKTIGRFRKRNRNRNLAQTDDQIQNEKHDLIEGPDPIEDQDPIENEERIVYLDPPSPVSTLSCNVSYVLKYWTEQTTMDPQYKLEVPKEEVEENYMIFVLIDSIKKWEDERANRPINPQLGRAAEWEDLPAEFKLSLIERLDIETRYNLSCCSTWDRADVEKAPIHLKNVGLYTPIGTEYMHLKKWDEPRDGELFVESKLSPEDAVKEFLKLFQNMRSNVDHLRIGQRTLDDRSLRRNNMKFFEELEKAIQVPSDNKKQIKLKVRRVDWHSSMVNDRIDPEAPLYTDAFTKFISHLQPGYFEVLHISTELVHPDEIGRLVGLEQWKQLNEVKIQQTVSCGLEHFYHLERIVIKILKLEIEALMDFTKNYLLKNLAYPNGFSIYNRRQLKKTEFINSIVEQFHNCGKFYVFELRTINDDPIMSIKIPGVNNKILSVCISRSLRTITALFCPLERYQEARVPIETPLRTRNTHSCHEFDEPPIEIFARTHGFGYTSSQFCTFMNQ